MLRFIFSGLLASLVLLSSGALIPLVKEGGARVEGLENAVAYSGSLNYVWGVWVGVSLLVVAIAIAGGRFRLIPRQGAVIAVLLFCALSITWAEFSRPALRVALCMWTSFLLLNQYITVYGWRRALRVVNLATTGILILSLFLIAFVPAYGVSVGQHEGKWQGAFTHKNSLGVFCALAYTLFLWQLTWRRTPLALVGWAMSAMLLWGSQSGSGTLAAATATLLAFLPPVRKGALRGWQLTALILLLCGASACSMYVSIADPGFSVLDKDSSLTGRNMIWLYMFAKISESPIWGQGLDQLGAGIASNPGEAFSQIGFVVSSAHNGFLETAFGGGIVGLLLALAALFRLALAKRAGAFAGLGTLLTAIVIVLNTFESQLIGFNFVWVCLLLVSLASAAHTRSSAQPSATPLVASPALSAPT